MRWNLGPSPSFFGTISDGLGFAAGFLSPSELGAAQSALDLEEKMPSDQRLAAAAASVQAARSIDSLNAKMTRWGVGKLRDALDFEALRFDALYPDDAPHAVLLGPRFIKDTREHSVTGVVSSISNSRIFDLKEVFGDPFWASIPPSGRLQGRRFTVLSGVDRGSSYSISAHVLDSPAYIRLDGDPWSDASHSGVRFLIAGDGLPETPRAVGQRVRDWAISGAIRGTLTAAAGAVLTCAPIFGAGGYWLDPDGNLLPGSLAGRDILIGALSRRIVSHDPASDQVTVSSGAGIVGNEPFRIRARSPSDTGKQTRGTLADPAYGGRYSTLEPGTTIRLASSTVSQASPALVKGIHDSMDVAARYTVARFARWRGSYVVFRSAVRAQKLIVADVARESQRITDLRQMAVDLNLPLRFPEQDA